MDTITIYKMEFPAANKPIYIFLLFPLNFYNNSKDMLQKFTWHPINKSMDIQ